MLPDWPSSRRSEVRISNIVAGLSPLGCPALNLHHMSRVADESFDSLALFHCPEKPFDLPAFFVDGCARAGA